MTDKTGSKANSPSNAQPERANVDTSSVKGNRTARTAGENRDFDESGASKNQAHGHPREERASNDRND
jgi:hypothetical protein